MKIENQIFILKKDVVEFLKNKVGEATFKSFKKLIDDIEVVNGKYLNINHVYTVLDAFYDDDELFNEFNEFIIKFNALPKVRFIKDYSKDVLLKEDVIKNFMNFLEEEQISPEAPDYNVYMNIINSIPVARLEV